MWRIGKRTGAYGSWSTGDGCGDGADYVWLSDGDGCGWACSSGGCGAGDEESGSGSAEDADWELLS